MDAFVAEGDAYLRKVLRVRREAGRTGGNVDKGDSGDSDASSDNDDADSIDWNAAVPDTAPVVGLDKLGKASRLKHLLSLGPRFEDMYGPKTAARNQDCGADGSDNSGDSEHSDESDSCSHGSVGSEVSGDSSIDRGRNAPSNVKHKRSAATGGRDSDDSASTVTEMEEEEEGASAPAPDAKRRRRVAFADGSDEESDATGEAAGSDDTAGLEPLRPQSRHERGKLALAGKIRDLEDAAFGRKSWVMLGEVSGAARPFNSLLQAGLDVDQSAKAAPEVSVETTVALEELIRQRIADAAWDDPHPKESAATAAGSNRPAGAAELSGERSAQGLGELYAQSYAAAAAATAAAAGGAGGASLGRGVVADVAEAEAGALLARLFSKLDALSNFFFTPKPPSREMVVASSKAAVRSAASAAAAGGLARHPQPGAAVPAIRMEEVLPMAVSDAEALAPGEARDAAVARAAAATARLSGAAGGGGDVAGRGAAAAASSARGPSTIGGGGGPSTSGTRVAAGAGGGVLVSLGEMSARERQAARRQRKAEATGHARGASAAGERKQQRGRGGGGTGAEAALAVSGASMANVTIGGGVGGKRPRQPQQRQASHAQPATHTFGRQRHGHGASRGGGGGGESSSSRFGSSTTFFSRLTDQVAAGKGDARAGRAAADAAPRKNASQFKL